MPASRRRISLGEGRTEYPEGTHLCLVFSEEPQRRSSIAAFLAAGLRARERVGYFAESTPLGTVREWVDAAIAPGEARGRLEVTTAESAYAPAGYFTPEEMLGRLESYYRDAVGEGLAGARVSGEMEWALRGLPGSERLVEYEARLNLLVYIHPVTAVCQYDARRFDGATLLDVLRIHPMMIVDGQIVENPYYVKAEDFLSARGLPVERRKDA